MVFDYFFGGAEDELTVRDNRLGWQQLRLRPRVLVDVGTRDLTHDGAWARRFRFRC